MSRPGRLLGHHLDLPWADAVLDLHPDLRPDGVPQALGDPLTSRVVHLGGWTFTPYAALSGGPKGGSTSVLVISAPDGWRGGVVCDQYSGRSFPFGQLNFPMPYLSRLLSPGTAGHRRIRALRDAALSGLPMLRVLLEEPYEWDPLMRHVEEYGDHNPYLLRWASSGVSAEDAAALEAWGVDPYTTPMSFTAHWDLLTWREAGFTDSHEVRLWHEIRCTDGEQATYLVARGLDAVAAAAWMDTPVPPNMDPRITCEFLAAGWTPRALREIGARANTPDPVMAYSFYGLVDMWATAMSPSLASRFLEAGIPFGEASRMLDCGQVPDDDTFTFLSALREEPTDWRPRRLGAVRSPYGSTFRLSVTA